MNILVLLVGVCLLGSFNFIQAQPEGCSERLTKEEPSLLGCLATPLSLFRLSEYANITDPKYSQFICPSMKIALQCIRHTLWTPDKLGVCTLDAIYAHTVTMMGRIFWLQDWWGDHAVGVLNTCLSDFVYQDGCNTPSNVLDFRTAIIANCAWSIMDIMKYGTSFTNLHCMNVASCSNLVKDGYSTIVNCNSSQVTQVYESVTMDPVQLQELFVLTGFNMAECTSVDLACLIPFSSVWGGMVYCLGAPMSLLTSSDVINFNTSVGVTTSCNAYLSAISCIKGRYQIDTNPAVPNNICGLADVYHPLFLNYLQYMANKEENLQLTAEIFNTSQCRSEVVNVEPLCPDREQIKTAIIVFCAELVYRTPVSSKCNVLNSCRQNLINSYRAEAGDCDTDSLFAFVERDDDSLADFSAFVGSDVTNCGTQIPLPTARPPAVSCQNVSQVFLEITAGSASECLMTFTSVLTAPTDEKFCEHLWEGLRCAAYKIENDGAACFNDMKREIQARPNEIYDIMEQTLGDLISGISDRIRNAYACPQARIMRPPRPQVPAYLRHCDQFGSTMEDALQSCVNASFNSSSPPECMRFGRSARCIANKLITVGTTERKTKLFEHMIEQCIELMVDVMEENMNQLSSKLGSLQPRECMKIAKVCGEGLWPLNRTCGASCPTNYTCEDGKYCCPMKRPGMCPKMMEKRLCLRTSRCDVDMDCNRGQKCCDQRCGFKTCVDIVRREKSACEMKFESFKERILPQRACGDGTGSVHVPQCQNDKFGPIQGDYASGVLHCVTEDGMKIYGSEFRGNENCPKIRPGKCPPMPSRCMNTPMDQIIGTGTDMDCNIGQKMCHVDEQNVCQIKCINVSGTMEDTPFDVCPNGVERNCCPADMVVGKVCVGRPSAVPRINPCGGCHIEFYDEHNKIVNCSEGVSECVHKRAMARMMNRDMKKNYSMTFLNFIKSRELFSEGMMEEIGMDLEGMRFDLDMDMMQTMKEKYEKMVDEMDEYGTIARKMEQMENDERTLEIGTAIVRSMEYMGRMAVAMCKYFGQYNICQNEGVCVIGSDQTEYLKVCKCEDGFHGLFCEIEGDPSPATPCMRYKAVVDGLWARLYDHDMHGELVHRLLTLFRLNYNLMPNITCTQDGMNYERMQTGVILPYSPTNPMVKYCVEPTTGVRMPNTLIAMGSETLNCDIMTRRDVLDLPNGCRLQPGEPCEDGGPCQYFYNSVSQMCEPSSRIGRGHKTLSQCYMECGFDVKAECPPLDPNAVGICVACPNEGCAIGEACCPSECGGTRCKELTYQVFLPKPCETLECDWASEFCLVDDTGNGKCKPFKSYCMQNLAEGFGNKNIGAYYFNSVTRRCDKFTYKGYGGNANRFYSLHQCQLECGVYADYKYEFPVCPPPMMLSRMEGDGTMMTMCDSDNHCGENHVCCSDGMQGVCTDPIRMCGTIRCSPFAKCENNTCICPTCDGEIMNEVCGDNGHRFDNLCMLKKYACEKMMNITVEPCPTSPVNPPSMCPMACTLDYKPICTIEILANGSHVIETFPNACALREKKMCQNRNVHPLYMGDCEQQCNGVTCQPFETCINGQCACPMCGTELSPVCARPLTVLSVESEKRTFPSICEMRRYGCQVVQDRMVIDAHEPCEKIDPEYECPATKMDIVRSAEVLCNMENNAHCSVGHKCCPYGAGAKCIPMKYLKRKTVMRPGFCPVLSYVNYNLNDCHKKEIMCEDDGDLPVNMKCCDNMVCGHKTIAAAIGINRDPMCGDGKRAVPSFTCNPDGENHACPMESTCTNVTTREGVSIGLCCETAGNSDPMRDMSEVYGNKLCNVVERMGLDMICNNSGRCVGDVHNGQMCQCPEGYFGTFCEKMVETPLCERMSTMFSTVFGLIHKVEGTHSLSRKKRDGHGGGDMGEEKDQGMDMYDTLVNPILMALPAIMKGMGFEYVPHDGNVQCENGSFARAQCFESIDEDGMDMCACVNPMTGMRIKNGPVAEKAEDLDCSFVSNPDFPQFCKETPSNASCSGDETEMWYFCPMRGECVKYMDRGCNSKHKNSFPTMALCYAKCGAVSVTPMECKSVRCPGGTVCVKVLGQIECLDVTKVDMIHEYPEPDCEENGDYSPMQCQGNTCHCVTKDGEVLADTFGVSQTLKCHRDKDGNTVAARPDEAQAKKCDDPNDVIMVCDGPGNPCNNCQMPANMGDGNMNSGNMNSGDMMNNNMGGNMRDPKVDMDGKCIDCETCPSGQGRQACTNTCESAPVCKQFPGAMCKVDKCTCEVKHYKSGNQMVNCEAAQSQCEKAKMALEQENATMNLQMRAMGVMGVNSVDELRCSAKGSFYAICTTGAERRCFCLNATNGMKMGPGLRNININSLDCSENQLRTIAKRFRASVKISDIPLEEIPELDRRTIVAYFKSLIERKFPNVRIIVMRLVSGSTNIYYEVDIDETMDVSGGTTDAASTADAIHTEIMGESLTVGQNVFIVSEATVIEFLTEEDLPATTPIPTEDDEDNTGLIIGCVVGGVALLLIIMVVIVICNRNKKSKSSSMQFSDLQGKDNPIYPYKA